ncbi:hypothetical protein JR316_0006109 [Psilocybe cubensis]|uniref:ATP synthase subunit e, mitochondrial n=2 Tax=Psilocybe cubensis TaxID=181762 RepID=A0A8H7XYZ6_PSICU|nr:hypothetical protein JR316_0006109 [Psilocybe cubensis]KAH9481582.1 hypothetical protein JR316_0006109 [Psilocybe cubensis]
MPLLSTVVGFSFVGLAARMGQLSIQGRNLYSNPGGHLISMGAFGFAGYLAHKWDVRSSEVLAKKRAELRERRQKALEAAAEMHAEA